MHFCLGSGATQTPPSSAPPQRCCLPSAWGGWWESCQLLPPPRLPGPPRGPFPAGSVAPPPAGKAPGVQAPKEPSGEPIWRRGNRVEIAQAASRRQGRAETLRCQPRKGPERAQLMPRGVGQRRPLPFPPDAAASAGPAPTAATGTRPSPRPGQLSPSSPRAAGPAPTCRQLGLAVPILPGKKKTKQGRQQPAPTTQLGEGEGLSPKRAGLSPPSASPAPAPL